MAEGVVLVVDPMQELPELLGEFEDRLRWAEADTDEEYRQIEAAAEEVGTLAGLLRTSPFGPLLAPDGVELARLGALAPRWRSTIDSYSTTRLSRLAPHVPAGAAGAFRQLRRCVVWSQRPDAGLLREALGRPGCRLTLVEYEAYGGLVRLTLADPLARSAALGSMPCSRRFFSVQLGDDIAGRRNRRG